MKLSLELSVWLFAIALMMAKLLLLNRVSAASPGGVLR
jgi:hypothetical protein